MNYIVNKREAAQFFDVTVQSLDSWFNAGCPVAERDSKGAIKGLALDAMTRWKIVRERERADEATQRDDRVQVEAEKVLLIRQQRIAQEMKNEQARRELAPVSLISWTLAKVGSQIAAILESIPLKIKTVAPRLSAVEIEQVKREVVKAQNAAANVTVDLDEYYGTLPSSDSESDPRGTEDAQTA